MDWSSYQFHCDLCKASSFNLIYLISNIYAPFLYHDILLDIIMSVLKVFRWGHLFWDDDY